MVIVAIVSPLYSFSLLDYITGKYEHKSDANHLQLVLNSDNTYRLKKLSVVEKGMPYDRIGFWEKEKNRLKLIFMGYDIPFLKQSDIVYQGCGSVDKKPIAIYEYKVKGNKLKPLQKEKAPGEFLRVDNN